MPLVFCGGLHQRGCLDFVFGRAGDAVNLEACLPGTWKSNKPVKADRE